MRYSVRFRAHGRVQGVNFRRATRQQADLHGLTGWVQNQPDGSVEGMATGEADQLAALQAWLRQGPALAYVTSLDWEEVPVEEFERFEVR